MISTDALIRDLSHDCVPAQRRSIRREAVALPAQGMLRAVLFVVLALPMTGLLAVLMRRAAPVHPERSALATEIAASTCSALIFTACCPMDDPRYIIVWTLLGVAAVTAVARWSPFRRFQL